MNGTPRYAAFAQKSAAAASRERYIIVNATIQTATAADKAVKARLSRFAPRCRTSAAKPSMTIDVNAVGMACGEYAYAARSRGLIGGMVIVDFDTPWMGSPSGQLRLGGNVGKRRPWIGRDDPFEKLPGSRRLTVVETPVPDAVQNRRPVIPLHRLPEELLGRDFPAIHEQKLVI